MNFPGADQLERLEPESVEALFPGAHTDVYKDKGAMVPDYGVDDTGLLWSYYDFGTVSTLYVSYWNPEKGQWHSLVGDGPPCRPLDLMPDPTIHHADIVQR